MINDPQILLLGVAALAALIAFGAALVCRKIAFRIGAVCQPRRDRWSSTPVPLLGGPAMVVATAAVLGLGSGLPLTLWVLAAGATALALVGLWDDLRPITPYTKLAAQLAAAGAVTAAGLRFPLTGIPVFDILITVAWLVGLTNAFNLLDNMDGLAAGIAAITGFVKLILFMQDGNWSGAYASAALVGTCLGFLALNFNPARIFMGDAGSMFLGFFVAGLSTIGGTPDSRATASVLVGPVAVMLVPIFDTVLVTVLRVMAGRPISQGGRDHTSHRLVTAGLSERRAVLTLYGLAAVSGAVGIVTRNIGWGVGLTLVGALGVAMLLLGVALSRIKVYQTESELPRSGFRMPLPPAKAYVRHFATAGIDGGLALAACYVAFAFRNTTSEVWLDPGFVQVLPMVLSAKMIALAIFRANNRLWRYTNSHDLLAMVQASAVGSALAVLAVATTSQLNGLRAVFVLDWILLTAALCSSRLALRGMAEFLRPAPSSAVRVIIYGAGDSGVALLQEIRNNPSLERTVVGFVDDDPMKQGTRVQGMQVFAGTEKIPAVLRDTRADEVILSTSKLEPSRLDQLRTACEVSGAKLSRFRLGVEHLPTLAQVRSIR
jgi:UDP-GlcNAc:undecaprenyl-phosphate GlcNAc-1-phosphate transferase